MSRDDQEKTMIRIRNLKNYLGGQWVHQGLNLTVTKGEVIGIIGASGCGKTTLLRSLLLLRESTAGSIDVFGYNLRKATASQLKDIRSRWGVMFQTGALFTSMSVLDNIIYPIKAFNKISPYMLHRIAAMKLAMVGLDPEVGMKYPVELSGGMVKRVAMARAIAMDPELIFLDEPTAGLDPRGGCSVR